MLRHYRSRLPSNSSSSKKLMGMRILMSKTVSSRILKRIQNLTNSRFMRWLINSSSKLVIRDWNTSKASKNFSNTSSVNNSRMPRKSSSTWRNRKKRRIKNRKMLKVWIIRLQGSLKLYYSIYSTSTKKNSRIKRCNCPPRKIGITSRQRTSLMRKIISWLRTSQSSLKNTSALNRCCKRKLRKWQLESMGKHNSWMKMI